MSKLISANEIKEAIKFYYDCGFYNTATQAKLELEQLIQQSSQLDEAITVLHALDGYGVALPDEAHELIAANTPKKQGD